MMCQSKIRYAKTANSHRIWHARQRSDMLHSRAFGTIPIGSVLLAKIRYAKTSNSHRICAPGKDPICKNLQFPSDLARSAKIRYAKTSNSHRILHARPRSDMQKPPILIGSCTLGQDPICKNCQFPSDPRQLSDLFCIIGSAKWLHRIFLARYRIWSTQYRIFQR